MKKSYLLLFFFALNSWAYAQSFLSNNNALISVKDKAMLSVQGSIFIENNGVFHNSDTIKLTQDWINNAGNTGFSSVGEGYVYFIGEDQYIQGTDETHFHNLLLRRSGIKYGNLDVYVNGFLDLDTLEFALGENVVYVTNDSLNAVVNQEGFVSSIENGGLSRATANNESYFFPVGSSIYGKKYRPVSVKPTANPHIYKVRFAQDDATNEGYDREEKAILICDINDNYFHKIWQSAGTDSADINFYFKASEDGTQWNDVAHWREKPEWQKAPADTLINGTAWDIMQLKHWNNYNSENFALAFTKAHFAYAGEDTSIYLLDTIPLNASGGDFYEWIPANAVSCADCPNPDFWSDSSQTMILRVEDADNCIDFDTINININEREGNDGLFIPSGISPNGDGVNDYWYIRWLYRYPDNEVIIVNRWEDVIYQAQPYNNDWYGTFNGKTLPEGTYYFILKLKQNGVVTDTYSGPISIIK